MRSGWVRCDWLLSLDQCGSFPAKKFELEDELGGGDFLSLSHLIVETGPITEEGFAYKSRAEGFVSLSVLGCYMQ